jgi:protein-S-isoprenylcysteine O-methyltransferase Ste14
MALVAFGVPLIARLNLGPLDPILSQMDPRALRLLGWIPLGAGAGLSAWGIAALGKSLTPGVEPLPAGEFVTRGPYRRVRHPVYTGLILALGGYTWLWANWRLALLVTWLAGLYLGAKAEREERWLVQRFPGYEAYRRQVPKLVPWGRRG